MVYLKHVFLLILSNKSWTNNICAPKHWTKPPSQFVKCNVDAALSNTNPLAASGIIVRDSIGMFITGIASKFYSRSPIVAEAFAFREAISFLANTGYPKVVVESDCLQLVRACKGEICIGEIKGLVDDIKEFRKQFRYCAFSWTPREGNGVAHLIARSCLQGSLARTWTRVHPLAIFNALQKDMRDAG